MRHRTYYIEHNFIDNLNYDFSYRTARKKSPKNSKERNGKRKETFPPAPLYKEKEKEKERKRQRRGEEKKKKSRRLKKQGFFYLYQTPEAFGLNTKSVWAKQSKRLGETPGGSFLMCNIGGIEMPLLLAASCPLLGIEGDSKSKKDNL